MECPVALLARGPAVLALLAPPTFLALGRVGEVRVAHSAPALVDAAIGRRARPGLQRVEVGLAIFLEVRRGLGVKDFGGVQPQDTLQPKEPQAIGECLLIYHRVLAQQGDEVVLRRRGVHAPGRNVLDQLRAPKLRHGTTR